MALAVLCLSRLSKLKLRSKKFACRGILFHVMKYWWLWETNKLTTYHSFFQHKMVDTRTSNHPAHTVRDRCCYAGMAQTNTESCKKIERRIYQVFIRSLTKDKGCIQVKKNVFIHQNMSLLVFDIFLQSP